jgi:uncharacterized protein Yka (UPF0111/DUF47 family)
MSAEVIAILVTVVFTVAGSSWLLANRISGVQAAVTETTHALDLRVAKVETARKAEDTANRVTDLEREVDRLKLTRCDKCPASRG